MSLPADREDGPIVVAAGILRRGPSSVGELAAKLPVSRPAVSQHLRVLREANLVEQRQVGTRRIYNVEIRGLKELREYLDSFWDDVLDAYREETNKPLNSAREILEGEDSES